MTEQEKTFFPWRQRFLDTAQDRSRPLSHRLEELAPVELLTPARWLDTFRQLEVLDDGWLSLLDKMEAWDVPLSEDCALPLEQLLCCFLYRHLAGALASQYSLASTRRQPASSLPRSGHWAPNLGPK